MTSETRTVQYDVIILGAGGAGLMCAAVAGQRGSRVLVLDHADEPGKKILISGGGRCNFTNIRTSPENFISANPHFAKSALGRYQPEDFIKLVDSYKIAWHEKTLGQLFCDNSAKNIVSMLLSECAKGHVQIELGMTITKVEKADGVFSVSASGKTFHTSALVVATGGPSIPKMGATGFAFELARQFDLKIVEPKPALVPFTLGPSEALFKELSGVAAEVEVQCGKTRFKEAALFTHKGLSGPAMLQISSYWTHGQTIEVNFLPSLKGDWLLQAKREKPKNHMRSLLGAHLPARLAETLAEKIHIEGELANTPDRKLEGAGSRLSRWQFVPNGTEGYAKAEVTKGGVSTAELSSKTMEASKVPGFYVIGEAVDVTGWLGGYNFQWAWASGSAAGNAIAETCA